MSREEIWIKYKESNETKYKQELIKEYVPLVKIVAGRMYNFYGGNVDFDDLQGYGVFGLIDAIEKFDINRELKFETYAQIRIRGSIIDNLRKIDWIPRSLRKKAKEYEKAINKIENKLGRTATNEDIAREMSISLNEVESALSEITAFNIISLEELLSARGEFGINCNTADNPEKRYEDKEIKKILMEAIDSLPIKEKMVVSIYYYNELTYKEIGSLLNLSESRISQIHSKAILKIKGVFSKLGIEYE